MQTTVTFNTPRAQRPAWRQALAAVAVAAGLWAVGSGQAQARGGQGDVYWTIGVNSPGVTVGVSNAPPPRQVVVQPRPVVVYPSAPVVIHQPYPYAQHVVVHPRPVVYHGVGPRWDERHERRHWKHKHRRHHHDRYDDDDRRGGGRR